MSVSAVSFPPAVLYAGPAIDALWQIREIPALAGNSDCPATKVIDSISSYCLVAHIETARSTVPHCVRVATDCVFRIRREGRGKCEIYGVTCCGMACGVGGCDLPVVIRRLGRSSPWMYAVEGLDADTIYCAWNSDVDHDWPAAGQEAIAAGSQAALPINRSPQSDTDRRSIASSAEAASCVKMAVWTNMQRVDN